MRTYAHMADKGFIFLKSLIERLLLSYNTFFLYTRFLSVSTLHKEKYLIKANPFGLNSS